MKKLREKMGEYGGVGREIENSLNVRERFEAKHYGEDPLKDIPNLDCLGRIDDGG